ncbi:MAG: hypothetical protein IPK37_15100 [Austwickia sp.]|nr:MAG: hypothetical protein IPK37_15100 [Austwickia sp.]
MIATLALVLAAQANAVPLAPVFHDGADDGIAAWGESMTVRGYDVGPAGAAGLRFSGW